MKKVLKSIMVVLISVMLLLPVAQPIAFAAPDAKSVIDSMGTEAKDVDTTNAAKIGGTISTWILVISSIVAVIVIAYVGLKFIVGSTQEKAEYKKSLIPIVVGVLLVVGASAIAKALFSINFS